MQRRGDLNSPSSCQIFVEVEFFLKFRELLGGEVRPAGVVNSSRRSAEVTVRLGGCNRKLGLLGELLVNFVLKISLKTFCKLYIENVLKQVLHYFPIA